MNLLVEEWGGKYQSQDISAKSGLGIEDLLEKIFLEAEMLDLKANPKRPSIGTVLEATLDKGKGFVSNVLVQNGTLEIGSTLVAGHFFGKVKAMFNDRGKRIKYSRAFYACENTGNERSSTGRGNIQRIHSGKNSKKYCFEKFYYCT